MATYSCEHLLRVRIAKVTFVGSSDWSAEGGKKDGIIWRFLENALQPPLDVSHCNANACLSIGHNNVFRQDDIVEINIELNDVPRTLGRRMNRDLRTELRQRE